MLQLAARSTGNAVPMLEQSPSLRKNRYFFQSSEVVNDAAGTTLTMTQIELEDPTAKALLVNVFPMVEAVAVKGCNSLDCRQ